MTNEASIYRGIFSRVIGVVRGSKSDEDKIKTAEKDVPWEEIFIPNLRLVANKKGVALDIRQNGDDLDIYEDGNLTKLSMKLEAFAVGGERGRWHYEMPEKRLNNSPCLRESFEMSPQIDLRATDENGTQKPIFWAK